MTKGEEIVRSEFNPSKSDEVSAIKNHMIYIIDLLENYKSLDPRLAEIVLNKMEEATMYAVKLVTSKK